VDTFFKGKVAVVTGGANGIGKGTFERLAELGARVVAIDKNKQELARVVRSLTGKNYDVSGIAADIGAPEEWLAELPEKIDFVVNAAAIVDPGTPDIIEAMELAHDNMSALVSSMETVLKVNYLGAVTLSLYAAKRMIGDDNPASSDDIEAKKVRRGAIVNVTSTNKDTLHNNRITYGPQKAALENFTKLQAKGLAPYGVRVSAVAPAGTRTAMVNDPRATGKGMPLGLNEVEDVVDAIEFLLSDKSSNITGEVLRVDGGRTISSR